MDWADEAWLEFEARMLKGDESNALRLLVKEAWLDGARTGIDQAQQVIAESMPPETSKDGAQ